MSHPSFSRDTLVRIVRYLTSTCYATQSLVYWKDILGNVVAAKKLRALSEPSVKGNFVTIVASVSLPTPCHGHVFPLR